MAATRKHSPWVEDWYRGKPISSSPLASRPSNSNWERIDPPTGGRDLVKELLVQNLALKKGLIEQNRKLTLDIPKPGLAMGTPNLGNSPFKPDVGSPSGQIIDMVAESLVHTEAANRARDQRVRNWILQSPQPDKCTQHKAWSSTTSSDDETELSSSITWDGLPLSASMSSDRQPVVNPLPHRDKDTHGQSGPAARQPALNGEFSRTPSGHVAVKGKPAKSPTSAWQTDQAVSKMPSPETPMVPRVPSSEQDNGGGGFSRAGSSGAGGLVPRVLHAELVSKTHASPMLEKILNNLKQATAEPSESQVDGLHKAGAGTSEMRPHAVKQTTPVAAVLPVDIVLKEPATQQMPVAKQQSPALPALHLDVLNTGGLNGGEKQLQQLQAQPHASQPQAQQQPLSQAVRPGSESYKSFDIRGGNGLTPMEQNTQHDYPWRPQTVQRPGGAVWNPTIRSPARSPGDPSSAAMYHYADSRVTLMSRSTEPKRAAVQSYTQHGQAMAGTSNQSSGYQTSGQVVGSGGSPIGSSRPPVSAYAGHAQNIAKPKTPRKMSVPDFVQAPAQSQALEALTPRKLSVPDALTGLQALETVSQSTATIEELDASFVFDEIPMESDQPIAWVEITSMRDPFVQSPAQPQIPAVHQPQNGHIAQFPQPMFVTAQGGHPGMQAAVLPSKVDPVGRSASKGTSSSITVPDLQMTDFDSKEGDLYSPVTPPGTRAVAEARAQVAPDTHSSDLFNVSATKPDAKGSSFKPAATPPAVRSLFVQPTQPSGAQTIQNQQAFTPVLPQTAQQPAQRQAAPLEEIRMAETLLNDSPPRWENSLLDSQNKTNPALEAEEASPSGKAGCTSWLSPIKRPNKTPQDQKRGWTLPFSISNPATPVLGAFTSPLKANRANQPKQNLPDFVERVKIQDPKGSQPVAPVPPNSNGQVSVTGSFVFRSGSAEQPSEQPVGRPLVQRSFV